jgi:beta-glucanase (GH16 family)
MGNSYDKEKGNWPACGEVGIVEFLHTEDVDTWSSAITNLHYGKTFAEHKSLDSLATAPQFEQVTDAYHTYSFEWTATTMAWYLDGQLQAPGKIAYTELPDYDDEFNHQEFFLLLSFAVGFDMFDGKLIGDPSKSTWPKKLQVDWVRVYQKD